MIDDWNVLPDLINYPIQESSCLKDLDIIIEYDGPKIVFGNLNNKRVFGIAVDEDNEIERWVFVTVNCLEEKALKLGTILLREALRKDSVLVIDFFHDKNKLRIVPINGMILTEGMLPSPKARLGKL